MNDILDIEKLEAEGELCASALEDSVIGRRFARGTPEGVEADLDALVDCIERE